MVLASVLKSVPSQPSSFCFAVTVFANPAYFVVSSSVRSAADTSAYAYLTDETVDTVTLGSQQTASVDVYYNAQNGKLVAAAPTNKYGKGTKTDAGSSDTALGYTGTTEASGKVIKIFVAKNGDMTFSWA